MPEGYDHGRSVLWLVNFVEYLRLTGTTAMPWGNGLIDHFEEKDESKRQVICSLFANVLTKLVAV
jgi:hypothetical protein